jgi:hypothetical protein
MYLWPDGDERPTLATNPYEVEEFIKEKNYDVGLLYIL